MLEVRQTAAFREWIDGLADRRATERISQRLARVGAGLMGDVKSVGGGVWELRVDHGPGYRLYFVQRGLIVILLLCGGTKGTQRRDIQRARIMAAELES